MTIFLLIIAMVFNMLAQAVLKYAVTGVRFDSFTVDSILKFMLSPIIWGGALLYGGSFVFYIFALSRGELSRISPVSQAFTTLGIVFVSIIVFHEALTLTKILGLLMLIIGTIIIFR